MTLWFQSPALSGVVGLSDAGVAAIAGEEYAAFRSRSVTLAAAQLAIVVVVFFVSTLRPWGKR